MPKAISTQTAYAAAVEKLGSLRRQQLNAIQEKNEAAQDGDLRENAYYHAAKEQAATLGTTIGNLEIELRKVEPREIDLEKLGVENSAKGRVGMGTEVTLAWEGEADSETMTIISALDEPGIAHGLKYNSPLGERILNKTTGETIRFRGSEVKILAINPPEKTRAKTTNTAVELTR